jgi:hypothetical protein
MYIWPVTKKNIWPLNPRRCQNWLENVLSHSHIDYYLYVDLNEIYFVSKKMKFISL